jgi:hypothetical protein
MFSTVIDLAKSLVDFLKKEDELRLEQRLRVSSLLEEISKILLDTSEKMKKDEYPHYNCVLMENVSNQLHFYLIDHVPTEQLDTLHKSLIEASQVEKQFATRKETDTIPQIEKTAAEFMSLALMMRL